MRISLFIKVIQISLLLVISVFLLVAVIFCYLSVPSKVSYISKVQKNSKPKLIILSPIPKNDKISNNSQNIVPIHDYTIPSVVNGIPPVISRIATNQKVIFLTIDDGNYKDNSVVNALRDNKLVASLFLARSFIGGNPDFFKQLVDMGFLIENHTLSHNLKMIDQVTKVDYMSLEDMRSEICGMAGYEQQIYGRRPVFFRPPGGAYSTRMLQAAGDCGMKAVVTWIAKASGGSMQYQIGNVLRPGDIVLMHFRPEFVSDINAFVTAMNASGLHTELLEDWL